MGKVVVEEETEFDRFKCLSCEGHPRLDLRNVEGHLRDVHHIDLRRTVQILDARTWYEYEYQLLIHDCRRGNVRLFWSHRRMRNEPLFGPDEKQKGDENAVGSVYCRAPEA